MRYAGVGIERKLACARAGHLCSFAPLRKCRLHLRAQKFRRLSLHCFRVGLDTALIQGSDCNQDKTDKYAHQKGASTLNVWARENHPLQLEDPLLELPDALPKTLVTWIHIQMAQVSPHLFCRGQGKTCRRLGNLARQMQRVPDQMLERVSCEQRAADVLHLAYRWQTMVLHTEFASPGFRIAFFFALLGSLVTLALCVACSWAISAPSVSGLAHIWVWKHLLWLDAVDL